MSAAECLRRYQSAIRARGKSMSRARKLAHMRTEWARSAREWNHIAMTWLRLYQDAKESRP